MEVSIRTWPLIPPFIEVEGPSIAAVRRTIKELGIKGEDVGHTNLYGIFKRYGQEGKDMGDLIFKAKK